MLERRRGHSPPGPAPSRATRPATPSCPRSLGRDEPTGLAGTGRHPRSGPRFRAPAVSRGSTRPGCRDVFWSNSRKVSLAASNWLSWSWTNAFRVDSQGFAGTLAKPFVQWLQGRLILAVVHEPLRTFGVGFDLLAAPFVLLSASTGAGRIGVDQRHRGPFWEKSIRVFVASSTH